MILPFLSRFALFLYILSRRTCGSHGMMCTLAVGGGRAHRGRESDVALAATGRYRSRMHARVASGPYRRCIAEVLAALRRPLGIVGVLRLAGVLNLCACLLGHGGQPPKGCSQHDVALRMARGCICKAAFVVSTGTAPSQSPHGEVSIGPAKRNTKGRASNFHVSLCD